MVVVLSKNAGDGFGQVQSISYHKVRKDVSHLLSPLQCFAHSKSTLKLNLAMAKPYIGLIINYLNPVYVII